MPSEAQLIAFYLPQFHPIPENDEWWGKGFTEWTNVVTARPRFAGHYQPHLPSELGFYDLRLPEVREAQAALARTYGIYGFCYYHYWFQGRQLLNRVFDEVLDTGAPDFKFCLCWANESWRRNWDGHSGITLIEQTYSEEDDYAHINWLARAFDDQRYIRVNGKPLFIVYRAHDFPDAQRTTAIWRAEAQRLGIGELYLCCAETHGMTSDPHSLGFDAGIEFPPHQSLSNTVEPVSKANGNMEIFSYDDIAQSSLTKFNRSYRRHPGVIVNWDNSARRRHMTAKLFQGSTPQKYEAWLREAIHYAARKPEGERLVFINAWNEWAEGTHLEPDRRFGRQYLLATARALGLNPEPSHESEFTRMESFVSMADASSEADEAEAYFVNEAVAEALDEAARARALYQELEVYTRHLIANQKSIRYLSERLFKEVVLRFLPAEYRQRMLEKRSS